MFSGQFEALQDELERRREECIQLRTVLANRAHDLRSVTQTSYGKDVDIVNEDGELVLAYQTQKQVNRLVVIRLKWVTRYATAQSWIIDCITYVFYRLYGTPTPHTQQFY